MLSFDNNTWLFQYNQKLCTIPAFFISGTKKYKYICSCLCAINDSVWIKDVYKRQPVELGVEKALGITKADIGKTISVAEYNAACRKEVMKFTTEWEDLTHKMGDWLDMTDPYITYDNRYIETLWWLLKQLYKKWLLYKGYTIQPYSPAAGLNFEGRQGFRGYCKVFVYN